MAGVPRLSVTNRVMAPATILSVSSEQTSAPRAWLKDQLRSKTWRSAAGWTIIAGVNDKLDFSDGTTRAATIAPGTYATGAALATAVQTAMNAVSTTCVVTYSGTTFKFTIARTGTLSLLWSTGANATTSIGKDLGFVVSADDTGASSYEADAVAYLSRQWIKADLGSALGVQVGIVINHNSGTSGTYTLQGNATDAWTAPTVSQVLSGNADIRLAFLSALQTYRYWRLLIEDVQNSLGYAEVGIWFAGPYVQPSISYGIGFEKRWEELSQISVAIAGAHFQDERPRRPTWSLSWLEAPEADRAALAAAFALVPAGKCFFMSFHADTTPTDTEYVFAADGIAEQLVAAQYFTIPAALAGALG